MLPSSIQKGNFECQFCIPLLILLRQIDFRCGDVKLVLVPSQFNSFGSLIFVAFIDFF